jgi:hypothetical protein
LISSLADLPEQPPTRVVLDALDEAASDADRRQIAQALAELAVLPGLRVAVATRRLAAGNPFASDWLLHAQRITTCDDRSLVDLDSDTHFDPDGLRQFAAALLAQDGTDHPGPPGAAWTQYRARHAVRDRLAAVIAERAGRNFLVAAMAADPLSTGASMIDPAARGFDPAHIPSEVGDALNKYLDQLPDPPARTRPWAAHSTGLRSRYRAGRPRLARLHCRSRLQRCGRRPCCSAPFPGR